MDATAHAMDNSSGVLLTEKKGSLIAQPGMSSVVKRSCFRLTKTRKGWEAPAWGFRRYSISICSPPIPIHWEAYRGTASIGRPYPAGKAGERSTERLTRRRPTGVKAGLQSSPRAIPQDLTRDALIAQSPGPCLTLHLFTSSGR